MNIFSKNTIYIISLVVYTILTFHFISKSENISFLPYCSYYINFILLSLWFGVLVKSIFIARDILQNKPIQITYELKESIILTSLFALFFIGISSIIYFFVHSSYTLTLFNGLLYIVLSLPILGGLYYLYNRFAPSSSTIPSFQISSLLTQISQTSSFTKYLLVIEFLLVFSYFIIPFLRKQFFIKNGKQFINEPTYLDSKKQIATYEELKNENVNYSYSYSISLWFFFNERQPNVNSNYSKYVEVFNYGSKPQILYNSKTNKIKVVMQQGKKEKETMYEGKVPLQKWTNVVINYDKGTLDVFVNGVLVSTTKNVVPYMIHDIMTIGHENEEGEGIDSGVGNIIYYDTILSANDIRENYNYLKNNPIL